MLEPREQVAGQAALVRAHRLRFPLGAFHVVDRDERRLAAHREPHVACAEFIVHVVASGVDRVPLLVGVGLRYARVLVDARDFHLKIKPLGWRARSCQ